MWFKPNPIDSPIPATLGPSSWLWLGAIISSSFVLFLLMLGLVTGYYIYPVIVNNNTREFYHYSYRCLWDMFSACACICLVPSVPFVWSKRQNSLMDNTSKSRTWKWWRQRRLRPHGLLLVRLIESWEAIPISHWLKLSRSILVPGLISRVKVI